MSIDHSPMRILRTLLLLTSVLFLGNLFSIFSRLNLDNRMVLSIAELFDFNTEANIPTLYSTLLILTCALLLYYIYSVIDRDSPHRRGWLWLSVIFIYLAIDENGSVHERLIPLMRENFDTSGYFYYGWIIPYSFAVLVLSIMLVPFLLRLPRRIQFLFLGSGIVFLTGSVGMEMLGGMQSANFGEDNVLYALFYTVEELLEMLGMTTFLYALLTYVVQFTEGSKITLNLR